MTISLYSIFSLLIFIIIDAELIVADRPKFNEEAFYTRLEPPDQSPLTLECHVENADNVSYFPIFHQKYHPTLILPIILTKH